MKSANPQFGLVLAGGGAKGAYQAGALSYLAEIGFAPHIIAGTSIGALNGAILSANRPFKEGVRRLNVLWEKLGDAQILRPNPNTVVQFAGYAAQKFIPGFQNWLLNFLTQTGLLQGDTVIFDPEPIERFLREAVNPANLKLGTELWMAAFPSLPIPGLQYNVVTALADLCYAKAGNSAHWFCVQDCEDTEVLYNLLLASAAIPLAFPTRKINGRTYVDGGLADNVPLGALIARGCTKTIVIHLENGSVWNRHNFPEQTIFEIRPVDFLNQSNTPFLSDFHAMLDFSPERIAELRRRGYEDAKNWLEPIRQIFSVVGTQRETHNDLLSSTERLINDSEV
ncbi:patatin-like phospholipase family protein [Aetokthonos hydrillicola Thurmond2011]|jgi:NTE family protein|uniref:Patatin-like phospholipase family protein n=1 Tax=Aetokthonos hydrillicola Thurmond2011 TaxID=2712845 RepID=A0AAP5IAC5_9CYAN|nr:patatin-like phospholipase family protein [Aetokthonos hydrillicola]MBO3461501.1 patatin-like phospholipase family protein [Aetokthonos hydrillicola CCALA 1050]MBW4584861.1 patatin-like phospholipase family protein [Aetokthonos hydrillicola CCALA 1050]MDR9895410.1 patatin-like phospholipase family protein [Aetokthonos hydrillicola Thurmond2011]